MSLNWQKSNDALGNDIYLAYHSDHRRHYDVRQFLTDNQIRWTVYRSSLGVIDRIHQLSGCTAFGSARGAQQACEKAEEELRREEQAPAPSEDVWIDYTNHKGERRLRHIVPGAIYRGRNQWHPELQWLLRAEDLEKGEARDFAMKDIHRWLPEAPGGAAQDAGNLPPETAALLLAQAGVGPCNNDPDESEGSQYNITEARIDAGRIVIANHGVQHVLVVKQKWASSPAELQVRLFDPHPGLEGCPAPLPENVRQQARALAGQTMSLSSALQWISRAAPKDCRVTCHHGYIGLERSFEDIWTDSWRVIRWEVVDE